MGFISHSSEYEQGWHEEGNCKDLQRTIILPVPPGLERRNNGEIGGEWLCVPAKCN